MKSWGSRDTLHRSVMNRLLQAKEGAAPPPVLPDNLTLWLAQLTLLYGVPVEYLTPDIRLLPIESMRFFYMDQNWQDRLVDGALSVGVLSSRELVFNEAFYEAIYAQIDEMQHKLRSVLRKKEARETLTAGGTVTGLLFRSCVVSGWPGLEVEAWNGVTQLNIMRMDRLSDNVLLCLFNGVPDKVVFTEPGEGLHFGIVREADAPSFTVYLRGLGFPQADPYPAGEQISEGGHFLTATGTLLAGAGPGVMDIAGLVKNMEANMPPDALENGQLTPAGFAIQMVQGAGRQTYDLNSPECLFTPAKKDN